MVESDPKFGDCRRRRCTVKLVRVCVVVTVASMKKSPVTASTVKIVDDSRGSFGAKVGDMRDV